MLVKFTLGRISGKSARIFKFSGLAAIRQSCRKIECDDSSKTYDVKKPTKYSKAEMFNGLLKRASPKLQFAAQVNFSCPEIYFSEFGNFWNWKSGNKFLARGWLSNGKGPAGLGQKI